MVEGRGMNMISKFQVTNSYGLEAKEFRSFFSEKDELVSQCMNERRNKLLNSVKDCPGFTTYINIFIKISSQIIKHC